MERGGDDVEIQGQMLHIFGHYFCSVAPLENDQKCMKGKRFLRWMLERFLDVVLICHVKFKLKWFLQTEADVCDITAAF